MHRICAVHVRPQLDVETLTQRDVLTGNRADCLPRIEHLDVVPPAQHVRHDELGLREVRRAGDVGDNAPGAHGIQGRRQQLTLQLGEWRQGGREAAPFMQANLALIGAWILLVLAGIACVLTLLLPKFR